jgi:hypothetical protein
MNGVFRRFPWPQPAGWYHLSVDDPNAAGETRVWMDGRPAILNVVARTRGPSTTD